MVWQDANSNGAVDAGELVSLTDAGIASISLVSNGQAYTAANGDVTVAGTSTFTRTDGSTGTAADAAFVTGGRSVMETERVAANSNNVVLAAAIAAAGLAVSVPAAASAGADDAPVGRFASVMGSVEAFDMSNLGLSTDTAMPALMSGFGETFSMASFAPASSFAAGTVAGSIGDLVSVHGDMMAPTALLAGSDMLAGQMSIPTMASNIAMPGPDALVAMAGLNGQSTEAVASIIADALQGGGTGLDINALLNSLPGQGIGANVGTETMASLVNGFVPSWDTGHGGGFTFAATNAITSEALVLHHDAIQPISNG